MCYIKENMCKYQDHAFHAEAKLPDIVVQASHALASFSVACQEYGKELKK